MIIEDEVFGEIEIIEPVLIELINSSEIQRLKNITQCGIPEKNYYRKSQSRFDHSIGVLYILKRLGAELEQQIAGLLHDVSTPTFSHVIDWVSGEGEKGKEDFHDSVHEKFILESEIPKILKKYQLASEKIFNPENFPLLENELPGVCADRMDYSLRDGFTIFGTKKSDIFDSLFVSNDKIIFNNLESGIDFARNFLRLQKEDYGMVITASYYLNMAEILKTALNDGIIKKEDFWGTENDILNKLEMTDLKEISGNLEALKNKKPKYFKKSVTKKFRYVDPFVLFEGKVLRVSSLDQEFKTQIETEKAKCLQGMVV